MGKATIERWYHQQYVLAHSEVDTRHSPAVLGIDEHFFSRRQGYATTFCNLKKQPLFLRMVAALKSSPFKRLVTLGKTLYQWRDEVVRM